MKKSGVLNQPLSAVIASMGHTDSLVICDCGLPIPDEPERIDLALTRGLPGFIETLRVILQELQVEYAAIAQETVDKSSELYSAIKDILGAIPISLISHDELKQQSGSAKAIVRTGEATPYANIILYSGVIF